MTVDEAIAKVQRILGFRTRDATTVLFELNQARIRSEDDRSLGEPWFLKSVLSLNTVAGTQEINLTTSFIRLDEDNPPTIYDSTADTGEEYTEIGVSNVGYLRANFPGEGAPAGIALGDDEIIVYPVPDDVYALRIPCFRRGTTLLAGGVETEWLRYAADMLIGEAALAIAGPLRDQAAISLAEKTRQEGRIQLMRQIVDRENAGQSLEMGGSD